ncbi:GTP pyrophosphokinase family protein [Mycobacterium sp. HNNTM2301]|uniref:GTP pyrophosphokinase n=1 Tax=Mycobacterium hainanense TaxID=3289775 RepID=UPI0035A63C50
MSPADAKEYFVGVRENHRLLGLYLEGVLGNICARNEIPLDQITSRAKDIESALKKMQSKNYTSHRSVQDLCGVRVVVRHLSDIARVRELIASEFLVLDEQDRRSTRAEEFGYSGYHMIVKLSPGRASLLENEAFENLRAEVQIRTILQHAWASISHSLDYKNETTAPSDAKRALHRIAAILEAGDIQFDQYKESIESLNDGPQGDAARPKAHNKNIFNVDSFKEITNFDWHGLSGLAEQCGWRKFTRLEGKLGNKRETEAFERLVEAVQLLDYANLSGLVDERLKVDILLLQTIADQGRVAGYVPFAIGPDVFGLYLCAKNHQKAVLRADLLGDIYRPELLDSSIASGFHYSGDSSDKIR